MDIEDWIEDCASHEEEVEKEVVSSTTS
jgi:hypothetical protein